VKEERVFEAIGKFVERGIEKKFTKRVMAFNERFAAEKILSLFGSKHRIKRRHISISEIKEVKTNG